LAFDMLMSDLIKPLSPLQIWMLECGGSAPRDIANNNLRVVVLKDAQQANQSRVASRLSRETKSGGPLVQCGPWHTGLLTWFESERV